MGRGSGEQVREGFAETSPRRQKEAAMQWHRHLDTRTAGPAGARCRLGASEKRQKGPGERLAARDAIFRHLRFGCP